MDLRLRAQILILTVFIAVTYAQELSLSPDVAPPKKVGVPFMVVCELQGAESVVPLKWYNNIDQVINDTRSRVRATLRGSTNRLTFNPVQDTDAGVYTCKSTVNGNELKKTIELSIYRGITITSPTTQRPNIYTNALIECDATANPQPSVEWQDKNGNLIKLGERIVQKSNGLMIKNITEADNGIYVCMVYVQNFGDFQSHEITVKVRIPPSMVRGPVISNAIAGKRFEMKCEASGDPQPKFKFFKGQSKIALQNGPQYQIDETNGILIIEKLKDTDEGLYVCMAYNKGGNASADVNVDVVVPPTIDPIEDVSKPAHSAAVLKCVARGDPVPAMSWKIKNTNVPLAGGEGTSFSIEESEEREGRITKKEYSLKFASLKPEDTNNYTCTARNSGGEDNKTGSLIVEFKPHFTNTPYSQTYGWENHATDIKCVADGAPEPTIVWNHNGEELEPKFSNSTFSQAMQRGIRQLTSTLTVNVNVGNRDYIFGTYICKATNIHGTTPHEIELKKAETPGQPSVSTVETTPTTIQLAITPPLSDGGQDILAYKILYRAEGSDETKTARAPVSSDPNEPRTKYTLRDLQANKVYVITVKARNAVGDGAEAVISETTPNVRVPGMVEITSSHYGDQATSYTAVWKKPLTGGSPLTHYRITYSKVDVKGDAPNWMVERVLSEPIVKTIAKGDITDYKLDHLDAESYYSIEIIAINSIGESPKGTKIFKTSKGLGVGEVGDGGIASVHVSVYAMTSLVLSACLSALYW